MMVSGLALGIGWVNRNEWLHPILKWLGSSVQRSLPGARNERMLQAIIKELHPNGGSSLRDLLNRIETKLERTHRAAKITLKMQRLYEEHEGLAAFLTDSEGRCIYANANYLALVGLTHDEILINGWKNVIDEAVREDVANAWDAAVRDRRDFHWTIQYIRYRTGEKFLARCDAYCVTDEDTIIGWIGHVHPLVNRRSTDTKWQGPGRRSTDIAITCDLPFGQTPETD